MGRKAEYRTRASFPLPDGSIQELKRKILSLWSAFPHLHFLDSHDGEDPYGYYDFLVAGSGPQASLFSSLDKVEQAFDSSPDWYFGHLTYEFHALLDSGVPVPPSGSLPYPPCLFYRPQWLIYRLRGENRIHLETVDPSPAEVWDRIQQMPQPEPPRIPPLQFQEGMDFEEYRERFQRIIHHLVQGDVYELNFCVEARARGKMDPPHPLFSALGLRSPAPFAAYHRCEDRIMIGASPERYLCRRGDRVLAQPIKGTAARGRTPEEDQIQRIWLEESEKDRAENRMIVDLMRNDLCRFCLPGTVQVPELMGIHGFAQVFQMISTIEGQLDPRARLLDPLRYSFPMGSMTGAPKREVMQRIQELEPVPRGLFSGTVGYIRPDRDFDFNVNIRSLFYHQDSGEWSYQTGGAITFDSDPRAEWEERRTKAAALEALFNPENSSV